MEHPPHRPEGGEHPEANSYGTTDPAHQAEIERARSDAAAERRRNRAELERLVDLGMQPDDAEALVEFHQSQRDQRQSQPTTGEIAHPTPPASEPDNAPEHQLTPPRIYVADLAAYASGHLHGCWLDATAPNDQTAARIKVMLASSPVPDAAEYAIHDHDGFLGYEPGEYESLALVQRIASGIAEHGVPYAAYLTAIDTADDEALDRFTELYCGSFDSPTAWAEATGDDMEWDKQLDQLDPMLRPYVRIDYAGFARDHAQSWDIVEGSDGKTHVFMR